MRTVTFGVFVVHWLTLGSNNENHYRERTSRPHTPSRPESSIVAAAAASKMESIKTVGSPGSNT